MKLIILSLQSESSTWPMSQVRPRAFYIIPSHDSEADLLKDDSFPRGAEHANDILSNTRKKSSPRSSVSINRSIRVPSVSVARREQFHSRIGSGSSTSVPPGFERGTSSFRFKLDSGRPLTVEGSLKDTDGSTFICIFFILQFSSLRLRPVRPAASSHWRRSRKKRYCSRTGCSF